MARSNPKVIVARPASCFVDVETVAQARLCSGIAGAPPVHVQSPQRPARRHRRTALLLRRRNRHSQRRAAPRLLRNSC